MLHLRGDPPRVRRNVQILEYQTLDDALKALHAPLLGHSSGQRPSTSGTSLTVVGPDSSDVPVPVVTGSKPAKYLSSEDTAVSAENGDDMDPSIEAEPDHNNDVQDDADIEDATLEREVDQHEVAAANTIQRWYRRTSRLRSSRRDPSLDTLDKNYAACVALADGIETPPLINHRRYIYTLRGPFPHAMTALDRVYTASWKKKSDTSKALLEVKHLELEKMRETMDHLM